MLDNLDSARTSHGGNHHPEEHEKNPMESTKYGSGMWITERPDPSGEQPQAVAEQQPLHFNERMYDSRMGRYGYVEPDSADIVKYGITRPTMPEKKDKTTK